MNNPWLEETPDAEEANQELEIQKKAEEKHQETGEHPLFSETPTDDLFASEDSIPEDEVVEGEKGDKLMKVSTFQKRVGKLISQREEARREAQTSKSAMAAARAEAEATKEILAAFRTAYKDNPHLAVWDAQFMAKLEVLSKEDVTLQPLVQKVQQALEQTTTPRGGPKMTDNTNTQNQASNDVDARMRRLDEREARSVIKETLVGIKPAYVKILGDHIVNTAEKLDGLTAADVVRISREYLRDTGIEKKDVLATRPKDDDGDAGKVNKPATGGSAKAGTKSSADGSDGSNEDEPERPKNLDEWAANRKKRRDRIVREFEAS